MSICTPPARFRCKWWMRQPLPLTWYVFQTVGKGTVESERPMTNDERNPNDKVQSSKFQVRKKFQASNFKLQSGRIFEVCKLDLLWNLEFGTWNFFRPSSLGDSSL